MNKEKVKKYIWLAWINLFISTFTFGGGYVVVPMIRKYFVEKKHVFGEEELMNMAAIGQSAPGAIAVNLSALAGVQTAGVAGAVISCICAVIPPLVILSAVSLFYVEFSANPAVIAVLHGMQAGVAALITDVIIDMCAVIMKKKSILLTAMIPAAFAANFILHINVALILLTCCAVCVAQLILNANKRSLASNEQGTEMKK